MINSNQKSLSVFYVHPQTGYFLVSNSALRRLLAEDQCVDCSNMTRLSASCYAATKHGPGKDATVARVPKKEKSKSKNQMKHGEMETTVSLDKYNGKLMNSIWGLYNSNSSHNFKKQNAESAPTAAKGQEMTDSKFKSSLVSFTIPQFNGIVSVETSFEFKKPITSLEILEKHVENLFNFPKF